MESGLRADLRGVESDSGLKNIEPSRYKKCRKTPRTNAESHSMLQYNSVQSLTPCYNSAQSRTPRCMSSSQCCMSRAQRCMSRTPRCMSRTPRCMSRTPRCVSRTQRCFFGRSGETDGKEGKGKDE